MEDLFSVAQSHSGWYEWCEHNEGDVCEPGSSSTTDFTKASSSGSSSKRAVTEASSSGSSGERAAADAGAQQPRNLVRLGKNTLLIDGREHEARIVNTTAKINREICWIQKV
jgi:hypothetical protein